MFSMYWDKEQQDILHVETKDITKWEEFHQVLDKMLTEVDNVAPTHPVYIIVYPINFRPKGSPLLHFRRFIQVISARPEIRLAITVDSTNPIFFTKMQDVVIKVYTRSLQNKLPIVRTPQEAWALVEKDRDNHLDSRSVSDPLDTQRV